ncbi:hypothetical protein Tco_0660748 [Tanacetum coccineum]
MVDGVRHLAVSPCLLITQPRKLNDCQGIHLSVLPPSRLRNRKREAELEDSDADEVSGSVKDSDKFNADGALDKKKKKRYIAEESETE